MMLSKIESDSNDSAGNSYNGQLLRDVEAISKALYLHKTPSDARSKSAGKTRVSDTNLGILYENVVHKDKKSSSMWNWKKPLKALAHIGHHRFDICFFLHVHSIEGLPASFNEFTLRVHWKRKDEVLRTCPSRVLEGTAEFEETLMHRCCVYGNRSGPYHSAKYEVKLFLIYASAIEAPGLDIGKHWVDLTRLLPLTLEELEGEKSSGKWTTSFKLAGKAKGATLNVSFGFSVMKDSFVESRSNMNVSEPVNVTQDSGAGSRPSNGDGIIRQVESVPSNLDHQSHLNSQSLDVKVCHEVLPNLGLDLSKSINFLYQKLNQENLHSSPEFDKLSEYVEPLKPKHGLEFEFAKDISGNEFDNIDFVIIDRGIELCTKEELKLEQSAIQSSDSSAIETINVVEIIADDVIALDEETNCRLKDNLYSSYTDEVVLEDCKHGESVACTKGPTMEELESALQSPLISESTQLESLLTMDEFLEQQNYMEVKSNCRASKMSKRSLSLDDITESVASDFLNMLGIDHGSSDLGSDTDPESPREHLLREFEKEALASGNFILDFDDSGEQVESGCAAPTASGCGDLSEDFDFSLVIQAAEEEHKKASQLLRNRREAKSLEDLETKALMREWGLNEKVFQSSPRNHSDGFGSPIELPPEEAVELPPLGDGFGPFVQTKGGGYLRSMNPALFKNSKNVGSLVMQVSSPVVLPAEMGSDILEILQHLASLGIEKLSAQANKLMPLEDITGKMLRQVAQEATPGMVVPERQVFLEHRRKEVEGYQYDRTNDNLSSSLIGGEMGAGYISLEDLTALAVDRIETLPIEGLRIQSGMSDEEAPSSISLQSVGKMSPFEVKSANFNAFLCSEGAAGLRLLDIGESGNDVEGLMDLSITLEEWLRLDAGISGDEDQISERKIKILAAHHAKCTDLVSGTFMKDINWGNTSARMCGLLGNSLTVALMVLLRDPLRNYEAVGASMLALVQVERVIVPQNPNVYSTMLDRSNNEEEYYKPIIKQEVSDKKTEEEGTSWFKITEVHLAGLNTEPSEKELWGTKTQQQSGIRWLLASGVGKSSKHPFSKSTAIVVRSYPQVTKKLQTKDILWSITSNFHNTETDHSESAALLPPIRNPDIIFPNVSTRSHVAFNFE